VFSGYDSQRCISNVNNWINGLPFGMKDKARVWKEKGTPILNAATSSEPWQAFHHPKTTLCHKCGVMEDKCPFRATRNPKTMNDKIEKLNFSIMTHERFLEWIHSENRPDLSKYDIWLDEEPAIHETFEINAEEITILKTAFSKQKIPTVVEHLEELESNPKTGTIKDNVCYSFDDSKSMQASVSQTYDPVTKMSFSTDPEIKKLCIRYLHFFRRTAERYAIVRNDKLGTKITWIRDRLNFDVEGNLYLLNASYNHSLVDWEGFKIVEPLKKKIADGVHIHLMKGNSTKNRLELDVSGFLDSALETRKTWDCKKTLLCLNKEPSVAVKGALQSFVDACKPSVANRGRIIGRNDWADHDQIVCCFGLFTTVTHIALLASLIEGQEIEGSRIWTDNGKLRMGGNGFTDATLFEADRRKYCNEIYQTLMRGIARNWNGDKMHVNSLCPSLRQILPLAYDLPGLYIWWGGIDIMAIQPSELKQNDSKLCQLFGMPDDPKYRIEARQIAEELLNYWRVTEGNENAN